jgi:hypothetical protein
MTMHRRLLPLVALIVCATFAAPAQANFAVGIGDQDPSMFDNSNFQTLKIQKVRYLVPFDWYKNAGQNAEVKGFMNRAQQANADILVHFTARRGCYTNGRYSKKKACRAPSVKTYKAAVKRFRTAYPFVTTFGAWNEANHVSQPTYKKPGLAAKYFLALRSLCGGCKIVAADVLDSSAMPAWLAKFKAKAKNKARIYGLHNYTGVNRKRAASTKLMLRNAPGEVWMTETGGILKFLPSFPRSESRQADRTKYMFSLAAKYDSKKAGLRGKITRLYNYQWTGVQKSARFDAGLVNPDGSPRKAYRQFKKSATKFAR